MSTDLPFLEGQIDALVNTIWWTIDRKYGHVARPPIRESPNIFVQIFDQIERIWDSVATRLTLAFAVPYVLQYATAVENPFRMGIWLVGLCIVLPWVYHIFIYTPFIDPLRHLPSPKVLMFLVFH